MSVVNCKVEFIRPIYNNLEEWIADTNNYYIEENRRVVIRGRSYPYKDSIFKIPAKIKRQKNINKQQMLELYKDYLIDRSNKDEEFKKELLNLKDKNLGCWCKPDICHGDILLEVIELL